MADSLAVRLLRQTPSPSDKSPYEHGRDGGGDNHQKRLNATGLDVRGQKAKKGEDQAKDIVRPADAIVIAPVDPSKNA
ncbi:hypothetical protein [Sphingopyxis sp. H050]|uniref:hypothetical protein n=1 Tax=Sphingopyxis sp. H050 TaxID=1759072 RepID=UPI0012E36452|nr:hypothetical protein [Sphingopyxis sp. H050]